MPHSSDLKLDLESESLKASSVFCLNRVCYIHAILGVGDSKIFVCKEKIIKKKGEGDRERQPLNGVIMIQDHRAKAAVTWAMLGRVRSGFIDILKNKKKQKKTTKKKQPKNKVDNYVVISLLVGYFPCGISL